MTTVGKLLVLYGSQTFTAQEIAERIWRKTKIVGFKGPVLPMDDYNVSQLITEEFVLFICATTGQGDEPDNMRKFWKFLLRKGLPSSSLVKLKFGVVGLGDSTYSKFNFVAKKLQKRLIQLGATPLLDVALCDYQHDLGHDAVLIPWIKNFFTTMTAYFPNIQTETINTSFIPRWKVYISDRSNYSSNTKEKCYNRLNDDIYYAKGCKDNFFDATYIELQTSTRTTDESHFQDVRHMSFRTVGKDSFAYTPGDVFNIRPRNSEEDINDLFNIFTTHNIDIKPHYYLVIEEYHDDMPVPDFLKQNLTLYEVAEQYWDLKAYPTQYFFSLLALISQDNLERDKCIEFSSPNGQEDWLNYSRRPKRTVLEVLHDFYKSASKLTIEILFELFSTIKPRSFSIASSCMKHNGSKIELLVVVVKYYTRLQKPRLGLASNWLKSLNVGDRVFGWIKKGTMKFPQNSELPLILIGPGTGLAPFRNLIQERIIQGTAKNDTMHLFFGCRYRDKDFHCRAELEQMVADGKLTLYCAFSRDQDNKIYVQHKISEHKEVIWNLINRGASIFISGNAKNMPDNVKEALVEDVLAASGGMSSELAKQRLLEMERNGKLQLETW